MLSLLSKFKGCTFTEHIRIPFCNLKWLKVETSFFDSHILVINTILEHSPNIKTLILEHVEEFDSPRSPCSSLRDLEENELGFCYKLLHLKSVRFLNFKSGMNEVKFARFLLGNSVALQKLVLATPWCHGNHKRKMIEQLLLTLPHASQSVKILLM
ncbi:hypothetical protein LguiA_031324 [Lonicera macranthoides]